MQRTSYDTPKAPRTLVYTLKIVALCVLLLLSSIGGGQPAFAATYTAPTTAGDQCTDTPKYDIKYVDNLKGLLKEVNEEIDDAVTNVSQDIYNGLIGNDSFQTSANAALAMYLIFSAIAFMFGFVQSTATELIMRMIKIAFVLMVINSSTVLHSWVDINGVTTCIGSAGSCSFFEIVVRFFKGGTDQLIETAIGAAQHIPGYLTHWVITSPFDIFDGIITTALAPKMFVIILAAANGDIYGMAMMMALVLSLYYLAMMVVQALYVYMMALIMRALLVGVAPIFMIFILFKQTQHLFQQWVNLMISFSLQPVFLFVFLSFFIVLIESALTDIYYDVDVCYINSEFITAKDPDSATAPPTGLQRWRFKVKMYHADGRPVMEHARNPDGTHVMIPYSDPPQPLMVQKTEIYAGDYDKDGPVAFKDTPGYENMDEFPLNPLKILIFAALSFIAYRLSDSMVALANEFTGTFVNLNSGSPAGGGGGSHDDARSIQGMNKQTTARNPTTK